LLQCVVAPQCIASGPAHVCMCCGAGGGAGVGNKCIACCRIVCGGGEQGAPLQHHSLHQHWPRHIQHHW
jgi:hypothetical protein